MATFTPGKHFCTGALEPFPDVELANSDGLLASGGDLSPERLLCAYSQGIFPWFSEGQPILWWSPDPRCVLYPKQFQSRRSLQQSIRKHSFEFQVDTAFAQVIQACAAPRASDKGGTWITNDMQDAYLHLHQLCIAHSVECWQRNQLVGGLYGVVIGSVFFGESMFSDVSDASKAALWFLCKQYAQISLIDCQMTTSHLLSLGAIEIPRVQFLREIETAIHHLPVVGATI